MSFVTIFLIYFPRANDGNEKNYFVLMTLHYSLVLYMRCYVGDNKCVVLWLICENFLRSILLVMLLKICFCFKHVFVLCNDEGDQDF